MVSYEGNLSVEGELNKLAWNISFGRTFAGIHYPSDCEAGLMFGENIALKLLEQIPGRFGERNSRLWLRRFNGIWTNVQI